MNLLILLGLLALGLLTYSFRVPKSLRSVPRVSFWGFTIALFSKITLNDFFTKLLGPKLKEKGYATVFWIGKWIVIVNKTEIASNLYRNTSLFNKQLNDAHSILANFMGAKNIANSNGDEWKRFRKPANPIFHQTFQPELFAPYANDTLNSLLERVNESNDEAVTATDLLQWMTLDILGKGIFNVDFEALKSKGSSRYHYLYHNILKQVFNPLYFFFPFLNKYPFGKLKEAFGHVKEFNGFIKGLIEERRADIKDNKYQDSKDLLTTLLKENDDNQYEPLTDEELIHSVNVFFLAGHDTTASSLSYAMYHLAKNQNVQDKLRKEIKEVLNIQENQDSAVVPTMEQIKSMKYLSLVIKETMRITPPVGLLNRILTDDYTIPGDNVVISKGTVVGVSIYAIHHDPKHFPNPEKFEPERFLNTRYDTDVYMPFGGGSRMCVGTNFSLMEQKVYLSMLVQKFILQIGKTNPDYENIRIRGLGLNRPQDLKLNFSPVF